MFSLDFLHALRGKQKYNSAARCVQCDFPSVIPGCPEDSGAELHPFYYHLWKLHIYETFKWLRGPFQRHQNKTREGSCAINLCWASVSLCPWSPCTLGADSPQFFILHFTSFNHNISVTLFALKYVCSGFGEPRKYFYVLHLPRVPECLFVRLFFFVWQKLNFCFNITKKRTLLLLNVAYVPARKLPRNEKPFGCSILNINIWILEIRHLWCCRMGTVPLLKVNSNLICVPLFPKVWQSIRFCHNAGGGIQFSWQCFPHGFTQISGQIHI